MPDGTYTLTLSAVDDLGNTSNAAATRTITIDNTAPTGVALMQPASGTLLGGSVTLQAAASDPSGVANIAWAIDGTPVASQSTSSTDATAHVTIDTSSLTSGSHTISVSATDSIGNTSPASDYTFTFDTLNPTVQITSTINDVIDSDIPVNVTATGGDDHGVVQAQLLVDNTPRATVSVSGDTEATIALNWDPSGETAGNHSVRIAFRDAAGNRGRSEPVHVAVDAAAPSSATVVSPTDSAVINAVTPVHVSAADDTGVTSMTLVVDGSDAETRAAPTSFTAGPTASTTFSLDTYQLDEGSHTIAIRAVDALGRTRTSDPTAVTVRNDTVPPTGVSMTGTTPWYSLSPNIDFSWTASDASAIAGFDTRMRFGRDAMGDLADWLVATSSMSSSYSGADGYTYCVSVRATDGSGNSSGWSPDKCIAVPRDERSLKKGGSWKSRAVGTAYRGTTLTATKPGASLTTPSMTTRKLAIVASTCKGCGSVVVLWNGRPVKTIKLASSTTRSKVVFPIGTYAVQRAGKLSIVVAQPGAKGVTIDGVVSSL